MSNGDATTIFGRTETVSETVQEPVIVQIYDDKLIGKLKKHCLKNN